MIDYSLCEIFTLRKKSIPKYKPIFEEGEIMTTRFPPTPEEFLDPNEGWLPRNYTGGMNPTAQEIRNFQREIQGQPYQPAQEVYEDIFVEEVFVMLDSFINNIRDERIARELNNFSSFLERRLIENLPVPVRRYRRMINRQGRYD